MLKKIAAVARLASANLGVSDSADDYMRRWDALGTSSEKERGLSSAEVAAVRYGIPVEEWEQDWQGVLRRATSILGEARQC